MADGSDVPDGSGPRSPRLTGWMIVTIVGLVGLAAVGITALVVSHSSSGTSTSTTRHPTAPTTTSTAAAPTSTAPGDDSHPGKSRQLRGHLVDARWRSGHLGQRSRDGHRSWRDVRRVRPDGTDPRVPGVLDDSAGHDHGDPATELPRCSRWLQPEWRWRSQRGPERRLDLHRHRGGTRRSDIVGHQLLRPGACRPAGLRSVGAGRERRGRPRHTQDVSPARDRRLPPTPGGTTAQASPQRRL